MKEPRHMAADCSELHALLDRIPESDLPVGGPGVTHREILREFGIK